MQRENQNASRVKETVSGVYRFVGSLREFPPRLLQVVAEILPSWNGLHLPKQTSHHVKMRLQQATVWAERWNTS